MFLKKLTISSENKIIREIIFHKGINLIVDETPSVNEQLTGNNVGKTTVLKLIDFCLGAKPNIIFVDPESKRDVYTLVKDFLIKNKVIIKLILKEDLDNEDSPEIVIERNFLSRNENIKRINGENLTEEEFELKLLQLIIPEHYSDKPTFRQIISHNIRYKDESINNTLKTLNKYTTDAEYETLYLFLLGCEFNKGNTKLEILAKLKQEDLYKSRLEKNQTKTTYEAALSLIESEIEELNIKKSNFNLNENLEADLENLNNIKYRINIISAEISNLCIRRDLIIETENELNSSVSNIDLKQLQLIYGQATKKIDDIQKTFNDLVHFHNKMIIEKTKFIVKELPSIEISIQSKKDYLRVLLEKEKELSTIISQSDSFEVLEKLIVQLNDKFKKKGEYEHIIKQLNEVESNITEFKNQLQEIDDELFSDSFEQTVKTQVYKFNKFFSAISNELYGEKYALKYDKFVNNKNQQLYKFSAFNTNFSSGKKQGEILCFDIAYTFFADDENISCLHFLLNDKKELMHDNQLVRIAQVLNGKNIQFVASILKDKLPEELKNEEYFVVKLSPEDKLFRIEKTI